MFSVVFLLILLAFSVTGSPVEVRNSPITLPMTERLAFSNVTALLRHDEARLAGFGEHSTHGRSDAYISRPKVPLSQGDLGGEFFGYTVKVNIGNPPTTYNLIVDTTSAITWVGSGVPYLSRSGVDTGEPVAVDYRYGSFRGTIFVDQLSFEGVEDIIIPWMQIGVVFNVQNIAINVDGVLGIGPTSSGIGALPNSLQQTIPTITDFLTGQSYINKAFVGMFFQPIGANLHDYGELCFGGTNPNMYEKIVYTDVTTTAPSSQYWGINQRITYGGGQILANTAGVLDSGCTFLYLASDAYERYRAATGGILNPANGLLQISLQQYDQLYDLRFHIGGKINKLVPNAQIWPRSLNHKINGGLNDIFLIVKALETPTGAGKDFVLGYVFLQRFYTAFDSQKRRIGFAATAYTNIDVN
ncbi:aspartic peptidase A1 [Suillus decipiens]|nr:aspartic peptidase A1 [Suillus decipiens]